jgi:hypothetical protein
MSFVDSQIVYVQFAALSLELFEFVCDQPAQYDIACRGDKSHDVLFREQPLQVRIAGWLVPIRVRVGKYTTKQCIQLAKQQEVGGREAVERDGHSRHRRTSSAVAAAGHLVEAKSVGVEIGAVGPG